MKFDCNGGIKTGDAQSIEGNGLKFQRTMRYMAASNREHNLPTRAGFTFLGYYTTATGGEQIYAPSGNGTALAVPGSSM